VALFNSKLKRNFAVVIGLERDKCYNEGQKVAVLTFHGRRQGPAAGLTV